MWEESKVAGRWIVLTSSDLSGSCRTFAVYVRHFKVNDARLPAIIAVHLLPYAGVEEPLHQLGASHAERILEILVRTGTVAVNGNRKA